MPGWTAVKRGVQINYDLENSPLQIRTNSEVGSEEQVEVWFYYSQEDWTGGFYLSFSSPPQYWLSSCSTSWTNFPTDFPTKTDKVWTITLKRSSGTPSVVITCNNKEVLNIELSDTTCADSWWRECWSRDVEKIYFHSWDTASDYYRPGKIPYEILTNREVCPVKI